MSRTSDETPFWAGGSPPGWFVSFHKEPAVVSGEAEDIRIRWFDSRDFPDGENGACRAAEALAERLNAAMSPCHESVDTTSLVL